jgi:hypothetical protein
MLERDKLLRISKQSIADLVVDLEAGDIKASDTPKAHGLGDGDVPQINDNLLVRVRNGLTPAEQARFRESRFRNQLQFDSGATVSRITDDSQRGQAAALA